MKRVLIFGTSYVTIPDKAWLAQQWARVLLDRNPDCDFLIVDTASTLPLPSGIEVFRFEDNVGMININGVDGFGRAFAKGFEIAMERGYDAVAQIDCDYIFLPKVRPIAEKVKGFASPRGYPCGWCEQGIAFASCQYAKESRIVERYDWQNPSIRNGAYPEDWIKTVAGNDFEWLPEVNGFRNDAALIGPGNVSGLDWITHGPVSTIVALLNYNGYPTNYPRLGVSGAGD